MPVARRIVLLGLGHTNVDFVFRWIKQPLPNTELVCVSNFDRSTYSGLFPSILGLRRKPGDMEIDLRRLVAKAKGRLIIEDVVSCKDSQVEFGNDESVTFDAMSIGVGSMPQGLLHPPAPTALLSIKPMQTFLSRFQSGVKKAIERSNRNSVRIVIVGGGVASVELAFAVSRWAEIQSIQVQIAIVTAGDHVAGEMSDRSIAKIEQLLSNRNIRLIANSRAEFTHENGLVLDGQTQLSGDLVIWSTSATAPSILAKLDLQKDDRGFIATDCYLRSLSQDNVFAVGDCGTRIDSPFPKAGVYAVRQAPVLWRNLRSTLEGESLQAFEPQNSFLKLLNTGDDRALLEYGRLSLHGRWCMFVKDWIDDRFIRQFQNLD
ncbi:MAG: FAD-dependent oxidoreductase [Planctomycetota bacterium]